MNASPTPLIPDGDSRVRHYDFRNQDVLDRGRVRRLHPLIDIAAHRMAGALSAELRQPVHVTADGFDQLTWDELRAGMEDPTFVVGAAFPDLDGRLVLHVPVELALALIEVLLGGIGDGQPDRLVMTDLEFSLMSSLADDMFSALQSAIDSFCDLGVATVQKLRSGIYLKMGRPGEGCLHIDLALTIADRGTRHLHVYWPVGLLTPVLEAFDRLEREDGPEKPGRWTSARQRLLAVFIDVQVSYPPVRLLTLEILSLGVGDVIPLGIDKDDVGPHLDVIVGGQCIAKGEHVARGKRVACTIAHWREEGT